jgi:hypothetical protein
MSELDRLMPPQIKDDRFYEVLRFLARHVNGPAIVEIGASSGDGSTEALARGALDNPRRPTLYPIEVSKPRFAALAGRYAGIDQVRPYNVSSVALSDFPSEAEVAAFHAGRPSVLNHHDLATVIGWLRQDISYVRDNGVPQNGIAAVKRAAGVAYFDLALIDGSEFTGKAELAAVYGAAVIALDDINSFKNMENHERLLADPAYDICVMDRFSRHGFSVFVRR